MKNLTLLLSINNPNNFIKMKGIPQGLLTRTNTNSFNSGSQDKRKAIANLQSMLKQQIQRRQDAQRQLLDYRSRSLHIQKQFARLLDKYDNHIAVLNGHDSYGQEIWNKLVNEIENFNSDSQKMLQKRCGQIQSMMTRRVNQILEKTEVQIKKNKKLSEEEYRQVKEEIKQALKIAKEIETENETLKKDNKQLLFKVNILREEKQLLIGELNQKKIRLRQLMVNIYEQKTQTTISSPTSSRIRSRKSATRQSPVPKFMCQPSLRDQKNSIQAPPSLDNPQFFRRISVSRQKSTGRDVTLKTDTHIKLLMERQKRRSAQLKGIVSKLYGRIKEVHSMIDSASKQVTNKAKQELIQFYQHLVSQVEYKLYIGQQSDHPLMLTPSQLSKLIEH